MRVLAFLIAVSAWGQITTIPGIVNPSGGAIGGASSIAATQVLYGTGPGVAGSEAAFTWDASSRGLNIAYPTLVQDSFAGTAGGPVTGRMPTVGPNAWLASGVNAANAYMGDGVFGVTTSANAYAIIRAASTPYEVKVTMRKLSSGTPQATISVVKDYDTWTFGVMWHVVFSSSGITQLYWNLAANGGVDVAAASPISQIGSPTAPSLATDTNYVCRVVFNGTFVDASIETEDGVVLFTNRAYDPLVPSLLGPWAYIQSADSGLRQTDFAMYSRPVAPNFGYGRFNSGIDGTPIGSLLPAAGRFSTITVGGATQGGVFQVNYSGALALAPRVVGTGGSGIFIIETDTNGAPSYLSIAGKTGGGGAVAGKLEMTGGGEFQFSGNNGTPFLIKPVNAGSPYFASYLGFTSNSDTFLDRLSSGVIRISTNGTTGGGLLIEGLKSTTGTRYVCVDTTGRFTSSATACSGT